MLYFSTIEEETGDEPEEENYQQEMHLVLCFLKVP
jgi:hypothetical protein